RMPRTFIVTSDAASKCDARGTASPCRSVSFTTKNERNWEGPSFVLSRGTNEGVSMNPSEQKPGQQTQGGGQGGQQGGGGQQKPGQQGGQQPGQGGQQQGGGGQQQGGGGQHKPGQQSQQPGQGGQQGGQQKPGQR